MILEIQVLALPGTEIWLALNRLMRSQPSPLNNWISKQKQQTCSDSFPLKRLHTISKMNDNMYT
jgi:hypothetical protein